MGSFFRTVWNLITALKHAVGNLLFLAILILILAVIFSKETITVPDSAALVIDPSGVIVEQKHPIDPINEFLSGYDDGEAETLLRNIIDAIDEAREDARIKAIVLDLEDLRGAGMSKLEEIGNALDEFRRESGKPILAFAPSYSQSQYYLASHADKIYLNEQSFQSFGGVFLTGLGIYPIHFKSAMDKLKVQFHVFRVGQYKGAVEPFTRDDMSPESKEANRQWLGVLWNEYTDTVVNNRDITPAAFDRYTNEYDALLGEAGNDPARLAVTQGLVDDLVGQEEWVDIMRDAAGKSGADYTRIGFRDYLRITRPPIPDISPAANKIAVITAKGTIYDGEQPSGNIGSDSISRLIKQAREDKSVKALVLRIDSPGGSASASEQIRAELEMTRNDGKPVVVSMSSYAASGGYWISATANRIFALTTTVTGSIGTFILFPTFEQSLSEIGINTDGVGTTALSGSLDASQPLNPVLERTLQRSIRHTYSKFINLVADGRDMDPQTVDRIAQGRVWSGKTAVQNGLVDAIGNLQDAIDSAAVLADVSDYEVIRLEKGLTTRQRLLRELLGGGLRVLHGVTGGIAGDWHGSLARLSSEMTDIVKMSKEPGLYLQCLHCPTR